MALESYNYWYLASYPRSGNTWCRLFIQEILKLEYISSNNLNDKYKLKRKFINPYDGSLLLSSRVYIDDFIGVDSSDLDDYQISKIRRDLTVHHSLINENSLWLRKVHDCFWEDENKTHNYLPTKNCQGVLYLIRNPMDVAVSLANFFSWDYDKTINFINSQSSSLCLSSRAGFKQVPQHLGTWNYHVESWTKQNFFPVMVIRYEDLISHPKKSFEQILGFLNIEFSEDNFLEALNNTSFSKLKILEKNDKLTFGKPINCKKFFRSGSIGEGEIKLTKDMKKRILDCCGTNMEKFSYV